MQKSITMIVLLLGIVATNLFGGTLIYKVNKEEKIISDVNIVSIDQKHLTLKVGSGTERILLSHVIKYYDTNIKIGSAFDDGSNDYSVFIRDIKYPPNKTGYIGTKKERITGDIELSYDILLDSKTANSQSKFREPYFYLFVLTVGKDNSDRKMFDYFYPAAAKCNFKTYDEALMMEKVLSSERSTQFLEYGKFQQNSMTSWQKIKFPLEGIKDRKIIAVYLVVWGKDNIVYSQGEILDYSHSIGQDWYANPK